MRFLNIALNVIFIFAFFSSAKSQNNSFTYRWEKVDGINIFYRMAGDSSKPAIIFFHGTPSSSIMYQDLMRLLANDFFLIAPDYPAHGYSDTPSPETYSYTFDNIANTMDKFIQALGINSYSIFMQDYGAPVGFRIAIKHPEKINALLIQNGNAYIEGFPEAQDENGELQTYWRNKNKKYEEEWMTYYANLKLASAGKWKLPISVNPDRRALDIAVMQKPGTLEIFRDLWYDYGNNVKSYPLWHEYLRKYHPPTLIMWGKKDTFFTTPGALAYLKDVPDAEVHLLNGGHWAATDTNMDEIADLIIHFFKNFKK